MSFESMTNPELREFIEKHPGYIEGCITSISSHPIRSELESKYRACMRYDRRIAIEQAKASHMAAL